ncbi:MAG TPA: glycosyltransferase [Stellaceae bacterium]|nr:glycosyltransferase [Stellaceae bacterium]
MIEWPLVVSLCFGAIVVLALFQILRQSRRYRSLSLRRGASQPASLPPVTVIVPARNERHNIESCLRRLTKQNYPAEKLRIIAVDDGSTDGTAGLIRSVAADTSGRVELIEAPALPPGWAGKPQACWLGARAATSEWLCFIDADTFAEPMLLRTAITTARRAGIDMASLSPFQEFGGFFASLVVPLGFAALAATQTSKDISVAGQFILIRTDCYFRVGGHAAHPSSVCEDLELARAVRKAGYASAVFRGDRLIRARMYRNATAVWEGFAKNLADMYGGTARTLAIVTLVLFVGWGAVLLPAHVIFMLMQGRNPLALLEAAIALPAALAVFSLQIALARYLRLSILYALLPPLSATAAAAMAVNSVSCKLLGRVSWKGRVYRP